MEYTKNLNESRRLNMPPELYGYIMKFLSANDILNLVFMSKETLKALREVGLNAIISVIHYSDRLWYVSDSARKLFGSRDAGYRYTLFTKTIICLVCFHRRSCEFTKAIRLTYGAYRMCKRCFRKKFGMNLEAIYYTCSLEYEKDGLGFSIGEFKEILEKCGAYTYALKPLDHWAPVERVIDRQSAYRVFKYTISRCLMMRARQVKRRIDTVVELNKKSRRR